VVYTDHSTPAYNTAAAAGSFLPLFLNTLALLPKRQGSVEPYTLVDTPAAWYGKDYQDRFGEWALQLTPQHVAELDAAVAQVLASKTIVQEANYLNLVRSQQNPYVKELGLVCVCFLGGGGTR
jgi:hypothetical protein